MEIIEAEEEFAADDGDVGLGEDAGFEEVEAGAAGEVFHDDPEFVGDDEGAVVAGDVFGVALGEVGDFLLDLGDVVVGVFEICCAEGQHEGSGRRLWEVKCEDEGSLGHQ